MKNRIKKSDHLPLWTEFKVNKLIQELTQIINRTGNVVLRSSLI